MKTYTLKQINKALYYDQFFGNVFKTSLEVSAFMDTLVEVLEHYEAIDKMLSNDNNAENQ